MNEDSFFLAGGVRRFFGFIGFHSSVAASEIADKECLILPAFRRRRETEGRLGLVGGAATGHGFGKADPAKAAGMRIAGLGALTLAAAVFCSCGATAAPPVGESLLQAGRRCLRELDGMTAKRHLEAATRAQPSDATAWVALAEAHALLGEESAAQQAAAKGLALSADLAGPARLAVEAAAYAVQRDWAKASGAFAELAEAEPTEVDYGYGLIVALSRQGELERAQEEIKRLRGLPPPAGTDLRIELALASVLFDLGDNRESQEAAERAIAQAEATGKKALAAKARLWRATALFYQGGRTEVAIFETLDEARKTFAEQGNRKDLAFVLELKGQALHNQGDLKNARKSLEGALELYQALGHLRGQAGVLCSLSMVAFDQGQAADSDKLRNQAMALFGDLGNPIEAAIVENELGLIDYQRGDLARALASYGEARRLFSEAGATDLEATVVTNLGEVFLEGGEPERALEPFGRALGSAREQDDESRQSVNLLRLGQAHFARGDWVLARDSYQEASSGSRSNPKSEETRIALAELLLAQGDAPAAERLALEAEEALFLTGAYPLASQADSLLVRALLARRKLAGARAISRQALGLAAGSDTRTIELGAEIAAALVEGHDGGRATALLRLAAVAQAARGSGLLRIAGQAEAAARGLATGNGG